MKQIETSALGLALTEAGIPFSVTSTLQHTPDFEYFTPDFEAKHGGEWATIDTYMITTPRFINVRVLDYARAIDILMNLEEGE